MIANTDLEQVVLCGKCIICSKPSSVEVIVGVLYQNTFPYHSPPHVNFGPRLGHAPLVVDFNHGSTVPVWRPGGLELDGE